MAEVGYKELGAVAVWFLSCMPHLLVYLGLLVGLLELEGVLLGGCFFSTRCLVS